MWKNRRRIVALFGGAAVLLLPFLRIRGRSAGGCLAAALVLLAAIWSRPDIRFAVQWEGKAGTPRGNVYRYSVRNDSDRPVALALSVEGPARLLDDPEVAVPSRGRVTGMVTVQGEKGTGGEILIAAAGRGFRIVRKAAFP